MASPVTHLEVFGDQPAALAAFYRDLLGWEVGKAEGVDYWHITPGTSELAVPGGGVGRRPSFLPAGWLPYVRVDQLDAALALAASLGAAVLRERTAIPRTGWYAVLADPAGNAFALWQADHAAFPLPAPA